MKSLKGRYCFYEIKKGFLYATYLPAKVINLEKMIELTRGWQNFIGDEVYPSIIDANAVGAITKEAREYSSNEKNLKGVASIAGVIKNPVMLILAKVFIKSGAFSIPVKLFRSEEEAELWSEKFKIYNEDNLEKEPSQMITKA